MPDLPIPDALLDALADRLAAAVADRLAPSSPSPEPVRDAKLALPITEAAERLGMSADSFRRHVMPEIRMVRVGGLRLVPVAELEAWIERHAARALETER